jgi:hypothetical protein
VALECGYRELEMGHVSRFGIVAQDEAQVERFVRLNDGSWLLTVFKGTQAALELQSLSCVLPLSEIYEDVTFDPEEWFDPRSLAVCIKTFRFRYQSLQREFSRLPTA